MKRPGTALNLNDRELYAALGERVRALRQERGLTLEQLGQLAGDFSVSSMSAIEKGRQRPTLHKILRIALALGMTDPRHIIPTPLEVLQRSGADFEVHGSNVRMIGDVTEIKPAVAGGLAEMVGGKA